MAYVYLTKAEQESVRTPEEKVNLLLRKFKKQVKQDDTLWLYRMNEFFIQKKTKRIMKKEHSKAQKKK